MSFAPDPSDPEVVELIRDYLLARFPDGQIVDVRVYDKESLDGDPYLDIIVVFEKVPEAKALRGLVRGLVPKVRDYGFPVPRYRSREADFQATRAAA